MRRYNVIRQYARDNPRMQTDLYHELQKPNLLWSCTTGTHALSLYYCSHSIFCHYNCMTSHFSSQYHVIQWNIFTLCPSQATTTNFVLTTICKSVHPTILNIGLQSDSTVHTTFTFNLICLSLSPRNFLKNNHETTCCTYKTTGSIIIRTLPTADNIYKIADFKPTDTKLIPCRENTPAQVAFECRQTVESSPSSRGKIRWVVLWQLAFLSQQFLKVIRAL